jgi:putative nucleotidyltransferase with HDIG domain
MRDDIADLFPEINEISDPALRDKVVAVWAESITKGGWTPAELKEIPFTLLAGKIDMYFVEHVRSCVQMCLEIEKVLKRVWGDRVPINHDVLVAGALLADVGKPLEYTRKEGKVVKGRGGELLRHPFSGAGLCYKHGLPDEVTHMVATHSKEGDHVQRTIESIIFHHADFIDFDTAKALGK